MSNYQMPTIAFALVWEFQPCRPNSILAPGAQLHLPLVVEEFLPFLLFSLPLLILSKNLVLQMPDFFQRLVAVLHTSLNSPLCKKILTNKSDKMSTYLFYYFVNCVWEKRCNFWTVSFNLHQCVKVWKKNQQINELYWLTIFVKLGKLHFEVLCSAGC